MKKLQYSNSFSLLLGLFMLFSLLGCDESDITGYQPTGIANGVLDVTINTFVQNDPQFSQFAEVLRLSGVDQQLEGGEYTLFLPTDTAFSSFLAKQDFNSISDIPVDSLKLLALHHLLDGKLMSPRDFTDEPQQFKPLAGEPLTIDLIDFRPDGLFFLIRANNIVVQTSNLEPTNGAIHVLKDNALGF
ncbi:MAG: hypothetical protein HC819_21100 [Cyclobacteriaceae bacterium]|nr:hypothetical protein [Cyclobacteriaceae bacterium]